MTHHPGDFIAYPTNRVVGTIADAPNARAAIEELLRAGVDREDIDILHGEGGLHRLDPSGAEHGFLARFQRTLIRLAGPAEESVYLRHHVEDVRAGRFVIMVLAESGDRRDLVAGVLNDDGAEFVGFYGLFAWTSLSRTRTWPRNPTARCHEISIFRGDVVRKRTRGVPSMGIGVAYLGLLSTEGPGS